MVGFAFREVYGSPRRVAAAALIALAFAGLFVWGSHIITVFPVGGVYVSASPFTLVAIFLTAGLMGITIPLHWFAWRKAVRSRASTGLSALGAVFSISAMSCCAPLLVPAVLSLVGVSGTNLLSLNLRLHQLRFLLFGSALALMTFSLWVGLRNVARACRLPAEVVGDNGDRHGAADSMARR